MILLVSIVACNSTPKEKSEVSAELVGNYGDTIDSEGAISTNEMVQMLEASDSVAVKVEGEILATCAMKGCWMNLQLADGKEMRVTFKDYAFFVPKEGMEGNRAVIKGIAKRSLTDVATLKHFAEDAGKPQVEIDGITEAQEELIFEAEGVIIYADPETE